MEYALHVVILCSIYVVLAVSLDLVAGRTGLLSVAHAAFFGLGAYASALLTLRFEVPFLLALAAGVLLAVVASTVLVVASLRLVDDYFVLAALGFQITVQAVFSNWLSLTQGPLGLANIARPEFALAPWSPMVSMLLISGTLAAICWVSVRAITRSSFGLVLDGIREDEIYVQSLGKNPRPYKAAVLVVSAAFAAAAGSVFAHYATYIDPSSFTVMDSINMLSMVIIGGAGGRYGPMIGAILLVTLSELLRFVGFPNAVTAHLVQVVYGAVMITVLILRPQGIAGRYSIS